MRQYVYCLICTVLLLFTACSKSGNPEVQIDPDSDNIIEGNDKDQSNITTSCNYSVSDNRLRSSPSELSFSGFYGNSSGEKYVRLENKCIRCENQEPLVITSIEILDNEQPDDDSAAPETGFFLRSDPTEDGSVSLKQNEGVNVGIEYIIDSWDYFEKTLRVHSNDKCFPELDIKISGSAKATSKIELSTPDDGAPDDRKVDFGKEAVEDTVQKLVISNIGIDDLKIHNFSITVGESPAAGRTGFYIKTPLKTDMIEPNGLQVVELGCRNNTTYPETLAGELVIESNDVTDNRQNKTITMQLTCGPDNTDGPTAVLSCDPLTTSVLSWPVLDGSGSSDSDGSKDDLTYFWTFAATPSGNGAGGASIVDLDDRTKTVTNVWSDSDITTFQALLKGSYSVRMMVKNEQGRQSAWAQCDIEAVPDDQLSIKLIWDNKNSDVDLHLISPDGSYGDPDTDCYFYNCSPQYTGERPDWGIAGDSKDDPNLDVDNTTGMGPETVYINKPANGTYKVVIHSYDLEGGPTNAHVKVYTHAVQADISSAYMPSTNLCWDAFTVTVTDGTADKKNISVSKIEPVTVYECDPPPLNP